MKTVLSLGLFSLFSGLPGTEACKVDIGEPAMANYLHNKQSCLVLTSPGSLEPGIDFTANGIHYLAVVKRSNYSFISTHDQKFSTPEGFTRATCFADLKTKRTAIVYLPGWAKFYILPSGWGCAFGFEGEITDQSKILYFFKRAR